MAMKSATKRSRRKSQREAARQKRQTEPEPSMDEEEELEVHFGQPVITPDSPRVSPTPDPEDTVQGEADYAVVLELVNNLRDKLAALNLDNANIRAACDALRRQCHSQGVAFGDLSQLVRQSLEGRQFQQAQEEPRRPHPIIRPELVDGGGNLRAEDIGITWQDGDTFLHGVRVAGRREDMESNRHRPVTSAPYPPGREDIEDTHQRPVLSPPYPQGREHATCRHLDSRVRCASRCLTHQHTTSPHRARKDALATDRRHLYSGSTTKPSGGRRGSSTSRQWPMCMDGIRISEHYRWFRTCMKRQ